MAKNTKAKPTGGWGWGKVVIPAGQSLSESLELTGGNLRMLMAPSDWSPANISFQVSVDDQTFCDLYDQGVEVVKPMGPGRAEAIPASWTEAVRFLKIRSGVSNNPVVQDDDRAFTWVVA
jgi:hypothetical protein